MSVRIGIDLGGTKIEGVVLDRGGEVRARMRIATPREDYAGTLAALRGLVDGLAADAGVSRSSLPGVGIGMPGSLSPATGKVQNANSTWLNGRAFDRDLTAALAMPVRLANDANCFALSEAVDGAAAGARSMLGIILGTGCGGGIVIGDRIVDGPRGIGGEWGHNPLPWSTAEEHPGPRCWCGRHGCMETWVAGPAIAADHMRVTGATLSTEEIVTAAGPSLDGDAGETLRRHAGRLARGLAHVVNLIDPEVIVIGGGLSKLAHLYDLVPGLMAPFVFADDKRVDIRPPKWGDAGGVRGAAWLWPWETG